MNKDFLKTVSLSVMLAASTIAHAELDNSSPYINPNRTCLTEGLMTPAGKDYRFLYSRDCHVVHILPPTVMPQSIKSQGVNLQACSAMKLAQESNGTLVKIIREAQARIATYEEALEKTSSKAEEQRLQKKITELNSRLEGYRKVSLESEANYQKNYGQVPGAVFSIVMDGSISQTDLSFLRGMNSSILNKTKTVERTTTDAKGNVTTETKEVPDISSLRPAQIDFSVFSFIYNVPEDAVKNGGIISTDIPDLEYLQQGGHKGVIHVLSNGGVSGKVIMSLTAACEFAKIDEKGDLRIKEDTDPIFTVNRTYEVQQMYAQGYTASLNVNKVVNAITSSVSHEKGNTFEKSQTFTPIIDANLSEIMDFKWFDERSDSQSTSFKEIRVIQEAVAQKLVDSYLEDLLKAQVIEFEKPPKVEPAKGGYIDETRVANRCWSQSDGGVSGWFGGSHTVCGNYNFVVKVWKDGVTIEDVKSKLTLNAVKTESMMANTMAPFKYTTAFVKQ